MAVHGTLFRFFDVSAPAYFILLISGFAFATAVAVAQTRRAGENPDVIVDIALAALLMGVVGARIFHVLFDGLFWDYVHLCTDPSLVDWKISQADCLPLTEEIAASWSRPDGYYGVWDAAKGVCHPAESDCFAWAAFWAGGLVYYGGLVFASITCIWLLKRDRFPVWKACDLVAAPIAIGLGFGRMGCLLAGCCFGQPHDGPLSLVFPPGSSAVVAQRKLGLLASRSMWSLPVYPTQAMESLMSFAVAGLLLFYISGRKRYDGQVFLWFIGLYAIGRFVIEFFRADDRGAAAGFSTSQWIGVVLVAAAFGVHVVRSKQRVAQAG